MSAQRLDTSGLDSTCRPVQCTHRWLLHTTPIEPQSFHSTVAQRVVWLCTFDHKRWYSTLCKPRTCVLLVCKTTNARRHIGYEILAPSAHYRYLASHQPPVHLLPLSSTQLQGLAQQVFLPLTNSCFNLHPLAGARHLAIGQFPFGGPFLASHLNSSVPVRVGDQVNMVSARSVCFIARLRAY